MQHAPCLPTGLEERKAECLIKNEFRRALLQMSHTEPPSYQGRVIHSFKICTSPLVSMQVPNRLCVKDWDMQKRKRGCLESEALSTADAFPNRYAKFDGFEKEAVFPKTVSKNDERAS